MKLAGAGVVAGSMSGWIERLAGDVARHPQRRRSCILLWMNGGPSQLDTFDLKPGQPTGGEFKEITTAVPGIRISEHLPKLAKLMEDMVLVRSMSTKEGDHGRATFLMRTGYLPQGPIRYPTLGSLISKELGSDESELPNFVSIAPLRFINQGAFGPGFLGPKYAPLVVGDSAASGRPQPANAYEQALQVQDLALAPGVERRQADGRLALLDHLERDFGSGHPGVSTESHRTAYDRAVRLMTSPATRAFKLDEESSALRDAYGRNLFGQGCLLARRLVERGVPFVEVTLSGVNGALGWDTHNQNFDAVRRLSQVLDPAWATLMQDLRSRGLLESTLIVWMGEFGRTPRINPNRGRDHYPNAWSTVLCGGGVCGGHVVGRTSRDGTAVESRPVSVADLLATVCRAMGIDPMTQNMSDLGRPIRIVDRGAQPIEEILT
jgi:hypothetical protein